MAGAVLFGPKVASQGGGSGFTSLANKPAGMTRIFFSAFTAISDGGVDVFGDFNVVQDPTAPGVSNTSVALNVIPSNFTSGSATGNLERALTNTRDIYISMWIKPSSNFQGEQTSTNKIMHCWVNGSNIIFLDAKCVGTSNPMLICMGMQGLISVPGNSGGGDSQNPPNIVPTADYPRGEWTYQETYWKGNTAGTGDGQIKVWKNGTLVTQHDNVQWSTAKTQFELVKLNPTWGGSNDHSTDTISWSFDDWEIWGAN